jgi:glycosyltransferase involved in cell wall biosynthesis
VGSRAAGLEDSPPMSAPLQPPERLRIAWLTYRGNPHCGGQGVYTRYLARELTALGHRVTVFSGPPYPELDDPRALVRVPSLDLYRPEDPFRRPRLHEFRTLIDVQEYALMCTAAFPEPSTFSRRAARLLAPRRADFDVVHDNQCLGRGLVRLVDAGWPVVATLHHPITVDRDLELAHATSFQRRLSLRRWYGFLRMQTRVLESMPRVLTVSESSRRDIVEQMGVAPERLHVVPVGVDPEIFRPLPGVARVPGRVVTTASADVPMKGLAPLLEAMAKVRTEREDVHLVVVGRPRDGSPIPALVDRLGLTGTVTFVSGVAQERIVELYAEAEVAVVPSLYEGFSLPAVEAMACGTPLVATTGGALPEVAGRDGDAALLVEPGDPQALAAALLRALEDPGLRSRLGAAGRDRAMARFTWHETARATADHHRAAIEEAAIRSRPPLPSC